MKGFQLIENKPKQYQIGIDTFERCEANMTHIEIMACCRFNIDKYNWRDKDQTLSDFIKIKDYAEWAIKNMEKENKRFLEINS